MSMLNKVIKLMQPNYLSFGEHSFYLVSLSLCHSHVATGKAIKFYAGEV